MPVYMPYVRSFWPRSFYLASHLHSPTESPRHAAKRPLTVSLTRREAARLPPAPPDVHPRAMCIAGAKDFAFKLIFAHDFSFLP